MNAQRPPNARGLYLYSEVFDLKPTSGDTLAREHSSGIGALEHWSIGALEHWSIGALEHWSIGVLEYWSIGALEYWSIGVLEYWSIRPSAVFPQIFTRASLRGL
jgi:hypothetical protein